MKARWATVAAYAGVAAANQLLWLTFAPITTESARHFGVSESAVGWLSQVFPLLYVVLAIPAGLALDRAFRPALLTGAWLTALGGALRFTSDTFAVALCAQIVIAIAQPLVLNAVTKVAIVSLPVEQHPLGISLGSAGIFLGTAVALPLAPSVDSFTTLFVIDLVVAVVAAVGMSVALIGVRASATSVFAGRAALRTVWADVLVRRLSAVAFLGFGLFVALTTWLQALLEPAGVSDTHTGWLLAGMVLAGVAGSAILPPLVARRRAELLFLRVAAVVAAAGCVLLALAPDAALVAIVPLGFVLLASLPVILELTERRAGEGSGAATALIWLAGNAGGIVVALLVQSVVHHPALAFSALALVAALVLAFVREERERGPRTRAA